MVPVLEAIAQIERNLQGGQTRPWIVTARNNKTFEEYVIKLFDGRNSTNINYLNKELIASVLAKEFDIPTPEPVLVHLNDSFYDTLGDEDKERVKKIRHRVVFGSRYYPTFSDYPIFINPSTARYLNPETIFAFDVLIRNFDRRKKKPNLLIDGNGYFCIDHEHSLDINKPFSEYNIYYDWGGLKNPASFHLFYEYLKKKRDVDFAEFKEYFRTFNVKKLEETREMLSNYQLEHDEVETIIFYFDNLIQNKSKFYELLNFLIS